MKVNVHKLASKHVRKVSATLLVVMLTELLLPLKALALTSGPSQPEFQGFTPLATTSLVDPFSGDFSYNIPLLEVEGYPLNLVYRATSNVEEEASWVGYGWNVNIGTLNRMVRGLPDDMNGEEIKSYQNIRERKVDSKSVSFEPSISANVGLTDGVGLSAGIRGQLGLTEDNDNYTGKAVGVSIGGGVFAGAQAGPFSAGVSAGVTLSANSASGGSISTYAGFNAGVGLGDYFSVGFGKSVNRTFNTISGWAQPNISGTFNLSSVTWEVQKNFINSISNEVPQVTVPYKYSSVGKAYRLNLEVQIGLLENVGIDLGLGITVTDANSTTTYKQNNVYKGYGYMYSENASKTSMLDFTRDNDGGINKDMPFMPPAMKTYDIFSSTAHGASSTFRADRNDFGTVRDPRVEFQNTDLKNTMHELTVKAHVSLDCWIGVTLRYDNTKTSTESTFESGGCGTDAKNYRVSNGKDQNLFFKVCGETTMADEAYLSQVNGSQMYSQNKANDVKGISDKKRPTTAEPIAVYTNSQISAYPPNFISKSLEDYTKNDFPSNTTSVSTHNRSGGSKIGAIMNTTRSGQTYVYATPVNNNIKNDVAFRINKFNASGNYNEREGIINSANTSQSNGQLRDYLYKNTLTPSYATSYMLNAVLSPDYVDVTNDGISDDDLGSFVKFNYTKAEDDYRWRIPYQQDNEEKALLNQGVRATAFDDMGSYTAGSKEVWYAHSMESKNHVVEFYLSDREDALDSKSKIMPSGHPHAAAPYNSSKGSFAHMQRLDSIKYYNKHDRYINDDNAIPLKTIYFDYDYGISSNVPNSADTLQGGKLRLTKVRVRHGSEPISFAEAYDFDYNSSNPSYNIGAKDAWGNYHPNDRNLPLCEFPYIDQDRTDLDAVASAFHMTSISLPSGANININYEADDYLYVQNKRAMTLTQVEGVGMTPALMATDAMGLYGPGQIPYLYIYVKKPAGVTDISKSYLLNGSNLMYFSFNINIAGQAFSEFDQVKGYAEVENIGYCPGSSTYLYIKVKPVTLTGTHVKPSPMVNTAINMARAYVPDLLYFQQAERSNGLNYNHADRLKKASLQVADAIFGKNSIAELMKDYKAAHKFQKGKSYVKLAMGTAKVGGGSRVSKITFSDGWNDMISGESSSLIGYNYYYENEDLSSSGVASYEPLLGGEENPFRSGKSYSLSTNKSKYPPYDPIEMIKEDPVGESFLPTGSVGYGRVVIESIHKGYARSAQTTMVHEYYTAKDFPFYSSYGPKYVTKKINEDYPNPGLRDILLSFLGVQNTVSSSENSYDIRQSFVIETNDMHGKPKANYKYRILPAGDKTELINSTEYFYHTDGNSKLANEVDVIRYKALPRENDNNYLQCVQFEDSIPRPNLYVEKKTLGVNVEECTDSREVVATETRKLAKRGGGVKICLPPSVRPKFSWVDNMHTHVDYFKSTTTTKIVNRYGILKSVRTKDEGAETIVENKYYDAITGEAVVQVVKDKYGDNIYSTNIPAYWTKTDLEPSYLSYPFHGYDGGKVLPGTLNFTTSGAGFLPGSMLRATFEVTEDMFHPGDELFVRASAPGSQGNLDWHRLYVVDVQIKKEHFGDNDPLSVRYGNKINSGGSYVSGTNYKYEVTVTPYKVNNLTSGDLLQNNEALTSIQSVVKFRSGRKNMLDISAGSYQSLGDPLDTPDYLPGYDIQGECLVKGLAKPVINASATSYDCVNSLFGGTLDNMNYNPVSSGVISQPYVGGTYALNGDRRNRSTSSTTWQQRGDGVLFNWYYWQPARNDSFDLYSPLKPMMAHYDNGKYDQIANTDTNAIWFDASDVTKSIPSIGAVEEKNPIGIYNSIFVDQSTKKVMHVTANGKFGQTWVETFEDMQQLKQYNGISDFVYSLFKTDMTKSSSIATNYEVYDPSQSISGSNKHVNGDFTLDNAKAHTGMYSLYTNSTTTVKTTPQQNLNAISYADTFDFNLDSATAQDFTYEVWVKGSGSVTAPSVNSNGQNITLEAVSTNIDGWIQYRATIEVSPSSQVTFTFPSGQNYDDIRVFPSVSNVKTYVYHPFKSYLMAVLDENNYATFYEYNNRNQLVRLKKETEKGVITITENIKNIKVN